MSAKDPIFNESAPNRDVRVPEDILIASYSNLVDKGRYEVQGTFGRDTFSAKVTRAGVANKAHSVVEVVNRAISEGRISVAAGNDIRAKVSAADTTTGFLESKFVAGSNITITKNNAGGNETLTIASTAGSSTVTTSNSVEGDGSGGNPIMLVNDAAAPGNNKFYGTNGAGVRGWYTVSGEANAGVNVGVSGAEVYAGKSGVNLQFRKLVAGTNMTVTQSGDVITFASTASGGGGEGSSYAVYNAGNGCYVVADNTGTTFAKNTSTGEFTLSIPDGVDVKGGWVAVASGDADASNDIYFAFNYAGSPNFNNSVATARAPFFRIQNAFGTPSRANALMQDNTLTFGMSAVGSGDIEMKINDADAFYPSANLYFYIP